MRLSIPAVACGLAFAASLAHAAGPYDGTYKGASTLTKDSTNQQRCPKGRDIALQVSDSVLHFRYDQQADVPIAADGSFSGPVGMGHLTGKIAGGKLEADAAGPRCGYHLVATKA